MKNFNHRIIDIIILALLDFSAVILSMALSMLIVHTTVHFTLNLLYWFLINLAAVYLFFTVFGCI